MVDCKSGWLISQTSLKCLVDVQGFSCPEELVLMLVYLVSRATGCFSLFLSRALAILNSLITSVPPRSSPLGILPSRDWCLMVIKRSL